jgi:hypothetical protein
MTVITIPYKGGIAYLKPPEIVRIVNPTINNGVSSTIWTPTGGNRIHLLKLTVAPTVAGRFTLIDGAGTILEFVIPITISSDVPLPFIGYMSTSTNLALQFVNNSGAPCTYLINAWGNEYNI